MKLSKFVRNNRLAIDRVILAAVPGAKPLIDDAERELWVVYDEGLSVWAWSIGVEV